MTRVGGIVIAIINYKKNEILEYKIWLSIRKIIN